jgi:YfiH family protein
MTEPVVSSDRVVLAEVPAGRAIPSSEIPEWRATLGVVAGVTNRTGPDGDFDLGLASAEPTRVVLDRWSRLQAAFPEFAGTVIGRQVHGVAIRWHEHAAGWSIVEGVDGHATDRAGILLTVSLADCIPIYLVDPVRRAIGLLHSGWRGTAAGIVREGIELLRCRAGSRPRDLVLHCGVGICGACYQVGSEVATACGRPGATDLDLRAVICEQAARQGVERLSVSPHCSAHMRETFFSHRGSGGNDGRMIAFLGLAP